MSEHDMTAEELRVARAIVEWIDPDGWMTAPAAYWRCDDREVYTPRGGIEFDKWGSGLQELIRRNLLYRNQDFAWIVCVGQIRGLLGADLREERPEPDFVGFASALRAEAEWSALIHPNPNAREDGGQSVSDQKALIRLAEHVEMVGKKLGFWHEEKS